MYFKHTYYNIIFNIIFNFLLHQVMIPVCFRIPNIKSRSHEPKPQTIWKLLQFQLTITGIPLPFLATHIGRSVDLVASENDISLFYLLKDFFLHFTFKRTETSFEFRNRFYTSNWVTALSSVGSGSVGQEKLINAEIRQIA